MSFRRFSGWEPAETTTYTYDEAGRVLTATTVREPEWDEQEQAWMLALAEFEDEELCPVCGGPRSVCQAPENEGRFSVPPPTRCFVATAIADAREPYQKAKQPQALMFGAYLKRP